MHSVNAEEGSILIKITFQVKERKVSKETVIQMEKVRNDQGESINTAAMMMHIKTLKEEFRKETLILSEKIEKKDVQMTWYEDKIDEFKDQIMETLDTNHCLMKKLDQMQIVHK